MPKLTILVGLPGSGKSTYAAQQCVLNPDAIICSSDDVRKQLYGDSSEQGNPVDVFEELHNRVYDALHCGKDVFYDATNVTRKERKNVIQRFRKYAEEINVAIIWAPLEECIRRDAARDGRVGKVVIDKFLRRWQTPFYDEGFDYMWLYMSPCDTYDAKTYTDTLVTRMHIAHDNPHHLYDIAEHCKATERQLLTKCPHLSSSLQLAARFHDIGKPYTKGFEDINGNSTACAHYYQHERVGAYLALGLYMPQEIRLRVSYLITVHMDPYLNTKYWRQLQKEALVNDNWTDVYEDICQLHSADVQAH